MSDVPSTPQAPLDCPYCGRPLKSTADRWLAALECELCGRFSDFGNAPLTPRDPDLQTQVSERDDRPTRATPPPKDDDVGEGSEG